MNRRSKLHITKPLFIVLLLAFVFSCRTAFAWSGPGHMTIAALAYRDLSADEKQKVSDLLKHHPDYEKWAKSFTAGSSPIDLDLYIFMKASMWPDKIRRKGNKYDHPAWHYVDYPLEPPAFPNKPSPAPNNDIVYAMAQCEQTLGNDKGVVEDRAAFLSWLIHLTGDIHQPLHCATLVNADYPAPGGDKGGNNLFVRPNSAGVNLHSMWDKALGSKVDYRAQYNLAVRIAAEHPKEKLTELTKDKTPKSWSLESRALAIQKVYLNGTLQGGKTADTALPLPQDYTRNMKTVAEQQAALAGFRLAEEIRKYLR